MRARTVPRSIEESIFRVVSKGAMTPSRHLALLVVLAAAGTACYGTAYYSSVDGEPPPSSAETGAVPAAPAQFTCDGSQLPNELPLPRLSRTQLERTLRFAISRALPAESDSVWGKVQPVFASYPKDQRTPAPGDLKGGYSRADQSIQQTQIDAMYQVGRAVGAELTANGSRIDALLGPCARDADTSNDRTCLEHFVRDWGSRVLRTPLPASEVKFFADAAGTTPTAPDAVADVITLILNSPGFLYRVEHGTDDTAAASPLSAFELASRLSYQFWQEPPDDELWAAAESGALLTPEGFEAQLQRMLHSPKVRGALDEFVDEWLRLDELPSLTALQNDPVFQSFVDGELPTDETRAAMIDDVERAVSEAVTTGGSASDLLWDRRSYTDDAYLASIYGVPTWDGAGDAPLMPSERRSGLLTRAALLTTGTASTRPIHKGYLVRNALLCQQVGAPPPNANLVAPTPTGAMTTRQAVMQLTGSGSCAGCHTGMINPPGFVLEGFDALGRERSDERLFDDEGQLTQSVPVDTTANLYLYGNEYRDLGSAVELTRAIDESRLFQSCLARHLFRFSQSRVESPQQDGCLLATLEQRLRDGAPLADVLAILAKDPTFHTKRFE